MLVKIIDPDSGAVVRLAQDAADLERCLYEISQMETPRSLLLELGDLEGAVKVGPVHIPDISQAIMEAVRIQEGGGGHGERS